MSLLTTAVKRVLIRSAKSTRVTSLYEVMIKGFIKATSFEAKMYKSIKTP
jgi:hypothetical protein